MESKAKILGHPIHPILIALPLGLLVMSVICDILFMITDNNLFAVVSFYNITGGILGGVLAAIFGFIDYMALPENTRAKRVGIMHGFGNLMVLLLFSVSWVTRNNAPGLVPPVLALLFSYAGILLLTITGWLGGELVHRLGVSVDPGSNLNAPNSLSGKSPELPRMQNIPVTGEERIEDEP